MRNQFQRAAVFLADNEIWPVVIAVASSIALEKFLLTAVFVILAFWPVRRIARGRWTQRTPADFAICIMVLMLPVTLWTTALPTKTIPEVYRLLTGIGLYYALVNWTSSKKNLRLSIAGVALSGLLLSILALVSVQWFPSKLPFIPSKIYTLLPLLVTDTIHPNVLAGYLVIFIFFSAGVLLFAHKAQTQIETILYWISLVIMGIILILTQSRGALIALAVALSVLASLRWKRGWILPVVFLLLAGITLGILGIPKVTEILSTSNSVNSSAEGRFETWSRAMDMIHDFPFTGVGMGSFEDIADRLYPLFLSEPGTTPHAHNLFLQVAIDLGLPGLTAWLAILMVTVYSACQSYRFARQEGDVWLAGTAAGFLSCQAALIAHGMLDAVTWGLVRPAPMVWAVWGVAMAMRNFTPDRPTHLNTPSSYRNRKVTKSIPSP